MATEFGDIRLKAGAWQGEEVTVAPEYEDCKRAALAHGVPLRRVYAGGAASGDEATALPARFKQMPSDGKSALSIQELS